MIPGEYYDVHTTPGGYRAAKKAYSKTDQPKADQAKKNIKQLNNSQKNIGYLTPMLDQGCAYAGLINLFDLKATTPEKIISCFRAYFGTYHPKTSQLLALAKFLPIFQVRYENSVV